MSTPSRATRLITAGRGRLLSGAVLVAVLVAPAPAGAQQAPASGAVPDAGATRTRLSLVGTLEQATVVNGSADVDMITLFARYTRVLDFRFLGGEPSWGIEVGTFFFDQQPQAVGVGLHVIYEQRFVPETTVHPVLGLGVGALLSDEKVPPGETRHNFSLFADLGLEARIAHAMWLRAGYRFHHVSNADTGLRNPGINANALAVGVVVGL